MANVKISGLTEQTTMSTDDLLESVDDPAGTPVSRKIKHINVVKAGMGLTGTSQEFMVQELLHDETLASAGNFDVSSISQSYDDLILVLIARSNVTGSNDSGVVYFNNDTTATNYHRQLHYLTDGAELSVAEAAAATVLRLAAASSPTNSFSFCRVYIPEYTNTNMLKVAYVESGGLEDAGKVALQQATLVWEDGGATAINRVTIATDNDPTDQLVINSRLRIIGVKSSG